MKFFLPEIRKNTKFFLLALAISILLYLLLPVSYYLYHSRVYEILSARKTTTAKIETFKIQKKEREVKEIEKTKKEKLKKFQKRFFTRFDLDLSVLSSEGGGKGIISADFENVIEEGEADIPPIKRIFIPPRYPHRAKKDGIEGNVVAKILIDENGNVIKVRIIKTPRFWGFDSAVIEAARNWKFEPAKLNNMPVKVWATQVVEFRL